MTRAILLVDHGSRRAAAHAQLEAVAEQLRPRVPGDIVAIAHLELAPPDIASGIDACLAQGATRIVVHPFFLGPGRHTSDAIPTEVARARRRHPSLDIRISEPLG
ncbi:MAG TPA: CbiX/SirB N-terminal domain-containing protein, partial [Myxococcota bacterium]|nr:CbiX/SirB N-terminal domain-containing protein [Myxococcota bacterium]